MPSSRHLSQPPTKPPREPFTPFCRAHTRSICFYCRLINTPFCRPCSRSLHQTSQLNRGKGKQLQDYQSRPQQTRQVPARPFVPAYQSQYPSCRYGQPYYVCLRGVRHFLFGAYYYGFVRPIGLLALTLVH